MFDGFKVLHPIKRFSNKLKISFVFTFLLDLKLVFSIYIFSSFPEPPLVLSLTIFGAWNPGKDFQQFDFN